MLLFSVFCIDMHNIALQNPTGVCQEDITIHTQTK